MTKLLGYVIILFRVAIEGWDVILTLFSAPGFWGVICR